MTNILQAIRDERNARFPKQFWGVRAWRSFVLGLLVLALTAKAALAVGLTAQVDRQVVPVGETFNLSLVFEGVSPGTTPNLPNLPNIQQTGVIQSSSIIIINGTTESTVTFTYSL